MHTHILFFLVAICGAVSVRGWDPSKFEYDAGPNYTLVWQDQFENVGPSVATINGAPAYKPNPENWTPQKGNINGGLQNYTDSIYNAYVQNNQLHIVAFKENYTSGMLNSWKKQEFIYGKFAAKIRMPYGQGIWPAWWLLGNAYDAYYLYWPTVGEIDIVEMIGGHQGGQPNDQISRGTVHWNAAANDMAVIIEGNYGQTLTTPDQSMLHNNSLVYWSEWNTTHVVIGLNEFVITVFPTTHIPSSINPVMAFHGLWSYFMILNIAIGGSWPGPPDNTTVWPQEMVVDWVRVYQLKCEQKTLE